MKNLGTDLEAAMSPTDRELVESCKAGDERAFATLFERHRYSIYSRTLRWCISRSDAEEVTQDTFICAYKNMRKFRGDCAFATWIFRIAYNKSINKRAWWKSRKYASHISLDTGGLSENLPDDFDLERTVTIEEISRMVDRAFPRLSANHQAALQLREVEDRSYEEISQILQINFGTVKSRLARGRRHLRRTLSTIYPSLANIDLKSFLHVRYLQMAPHDL